MAKRDTVNWKYIEELKKAEEFKTLWVPYGLPEIVDPFTSKYGNIEVQPRWDIPEKVVISQTINGAFYSKKSNPNRPWKRGRWMNSLATRSRTASGAQGVHAADPAES